ncbi:MAG: VOC family protein, partial [Chloroflexota bacterium]
PILELLLEPNSEYPAMKALKEALVRDGIPWTQFLVEDVHVEYTRLKDLGVVFTIEPTEMGTTTVAIFDDTCGNLIQIYQMNE